jgi:hypothetical protein
VQLLINKPNSFTWKCRQKTIETTSQKLTGAI